ncbi:hypothetical protein GIB67_041474 [Kingdonia uniflora]|uniref:Uncharacterized protein n=1 Tax=Kingdonia uniflora TaxID=39325 RepID=A0A7J7LRS0_9MAGN|nr:hypothetical protein GIB67_041474 [Kingdonia uniflora]
MWLLHLTPDNDPAPTLKDLHRVDILPDSWVHIFIGSEELPNRDKIQCRGSLDKVDAFTDSPFKGNPAAVCLLEEERDEKWLQLVATEFNISQTCYLTRLITNSNIHDDDSVNLINPRFRLRWFTPVAEVKLCGHGTIAAAHVLFKSGTITTAVIEFVTLSGLLTAKKVVEVGRLDSSKFSDGCTEEYSIELDFPTVAVLECAPLEIPSIPATLNNVLVMNMKKTATEGDIIVELSSGEAVVNLQPQFDEIEKCSARGVIVTGVAPTGSGFDFFSRFFCPKFGINELLPKILANSKAR